MATALLIKLKFCSICLRLMSLDKKCEGTGCNNWAAHITWGSNIPGPNFFEFEWVGGAIGASDPLSCIFLLLNMLKTAEVISFLRPGVNIIFLLPCLSCLLLGQPFGLWAVGFGFPHFDSFTSVMLLQNIHSWMRISTRLTPHSTSGYLKLWFTTTPPVFEKIDGGPAVAV